MSNVFTGSNREKFKNDKNGQSDSSRIIKILVVQILFLPAVSVRYCVER